MKLHFEPISQNMMNNMTDYLVTSPEEFTVRDFILHVRTDSACEGRPWMGKIEKANDGDEPSAIMRYLRGELYWGDGGNPSVIVGAKMLFNQIGTKKVTRVFATGDEEQFDYLLFVEGEYEMS